MNKRVIAWTLTWSFLSLFWITNAIYKAASTSAPQLASSLLVRPSDWQH